MGDDLLTRLRPADGSVAAIRTALAAAKEEQTVAATRIAELATRRKEMLLTASSAELRAVEDAERDAGRDAERLDAFVEALDAELGVASAAEATQDFERRFACAADAITRFNVWMSKHYEKHARALVEGVELEGAALAAINGLRRHDRTIPAGLPPRALAYVGREGRTLSALLRLPAATPGEPLFWG